MGATELQKTLLEYIKLLPKDTGNIKHRCEYWEFELKNENINKAFDTVKNDIDVLILQLPLDKSICITRAKIKKDLQTQILTQMSKLITDYKG